MPDIFEDGVNGLLVPPGDPPALADAIERLLDDPDQRRSMGETNRRKALEEFDVPIYVRTLGPIPRLAPIA